MQFEQISIVGVGLLGGSLGLAVKRLGLARSVVGVGHRNSTLEAAVKRGAIDRWTLSMAEGVRGADLVVLCTPVGLFGPLMARAAGTLARGCLVTDVGSTKRAVLQACLPHLPRGCNFVGSHPLAGSEARGIDAASDHLYDGALVLVVPTDRSDEKSVETIESLWQALGSHTRRIDAESHDRFLAQASHLPHMVAVALVEALGSDAERLVATGFLDTTRIASGDPPMWRDIFMTNRDQLLKALERFENILSEMKEALDAGDAVAVEKLLREAKSRRDRLLKSP